MNTPTQRLLPLFLVLSTAAGCHLFSSGQLNTTDGASSTASTPAEASTLTPETGTAPPEDTGEGTDTDTGTGTDTGLYGGTATPTYPPIRITINVHGHNYGFAEPGEDDEWYARKLDRYESDKEQILWIADLAESVGARANFQLNGEYCRDARLLLDASDTDHLLDLEARGHVLGSHFHMFRFSGVDEYWESVDSATATEDDLRQIWEDQVTECERVVGHSLFRIDPALVSTGFDSTPVVRDLSEAYGTPVEPAGETFSYTNWNHKPWNPFRRKLDTKLTEDPDREVLGIMSIGQIGQLEPQGKHQMMATVPQVQRQFLAMVAEWREHERLGLPPKQWQFGIMTHPHQTITYAEELRETVLWLAEWTEQTTDSGNLVAEFATDEEVLAHFEEWEMSEYAGSSFSFDWEGYLAGEAIPYPYSLEGVTLGLKDAELDAELMDWRDDGVQVFRLYRRDVGRSPPSAEGLSHLNIGDVMTTPLYLMWSTTGETVTLDFSAEAGGTLVQMNSATGEFGSVDATRLVVPPGAIVVSEAFVEGE